MSTISEAETRALKQQVASRLAEHRQRRPRGAEAYPSSPVDLPTSPRKSRIADQVAARFAQSQSYRDFLQQEAESAIRQAAASAEVARRSAEAVAAAQQQLLVEIEQWNAQAVAAQDAAAQQGPAEVIEFSAYPAEEAPVAEFSAYTAATTVAPAASAAEALRVAPEARSVAAQQVAAQQDVAQQNVAQQAFFAETMAAAAAAPVAEPEPPAPLTLAERFGLPTGPLDSAIAIPANLIEFPRQLIAARRARPRFAEGPLRDEADASPEQAQLRIFEVESSFVSTEPMVETALPEWQTIRLEGQHELTFEVLPESGVSFAAPLHVAPVSLRMMAVAVDACCIATSFLLAVAVAGYISPTLPTGLTAVASAAGALFLLGLFYQMLFFSLSDSTPGMRYARLGLCTFGDENPSRPAMRRRVGALLLAGVPLGLGLLWTCLDEEGLGWHDRMSRMYPRAY